MLLFSGIYDVINSPKKRLDDRTTRFCRTRIRHFAAGFDRLVHVAIEIPTRRTSQRRSSGRGHGLTGTTRPARTSHADAAASTASPARNQDDNEIAPQG